MFFDTADTFSDGADAETTLGIPVLGHIPLVKEENLRVMQGLDSGHPLLENFRSLRVGIRFAPEIPVRSLLITSAVPQEGKSTIAANLAIAVAMAMSVNGKKVLLVDSDLRRPKLHKLLGMDATKGLVDVLQGKEALAESIQPTALENLLFLPAGTPPPNPTELLESDAMARLLTEVNAMFDMVLLDSPCVLAVADATVLAPQVDGTLVVIGFKETKYSF